MGLYREAKPATFCESNVYFGDLVGSTQSAEVDSIGGESFWEYGLNSHCSTWDELPSDTISWHSLIQVKGFHHVLSLVSIHITA